MLRPSQIAALAAALVAASACAVGPRVQTTTVTTIHQVAVVPAPLAPSFAAPPLRRGELGLEVGAAHGRVVQSAANVGHLLAVPAASARLSYGTARVEAMVSGELGGTGGARPTSDLWTDGGRGVVGRAGPGLRIHGRLGPRLDLAWTASTDVLVVRLRRLHEQTVTRYITGHWLDGETGAWEEPTTEVSELVQSGTKTSAWVAGQTGLQGWYAVGEDLQLGTGASLSVQPRFWAERSFTETCHGTLDAPRAYGCTGATDGPRTEASAAASMYLSLAWRQGPLMFTGTAFGRATLDGVRDLPYGAAIGVRYALQTRAPAAAR